MGSKKQSGFFNRELSWLEFNQRVLDLAQDETVPPLERLKFLSIAASNLDEFFMVRVGGLQMLQAEGGRKKDISGLTATELIELISGRVRKMTADQYICFEKKLAPALMKADIRQLRAEELDKEQHEHCLYYFTSMVFPLLTPVAISVKRPLPLIKGGLLHFLVKLQNKKIPIYAIIPLPANINRFVTLPSRDKGYRFILLEDLIGMYLEHLFPGEILVEKTKFRITRNADMSVQEDKAYDLLAQMENIIDERKRSACIRLEVDAAITSTALKYLRTILHVHESLVFMIQGPHKFADFMVLALIEGYPSLNYEAWKQFIPQEFKSGTSVFTILSQKPVVLYHPYESFDPVLRLINEAADDPDVLAIKQILYRTSQKSPIVAALKRAAENGKTVTALVELKARFDEERNIEWAKQLEDAGVQVIYGIRNLKTHAKLCIIIRREPQGIRRYCHVGTGNYNEKTALLYCDISYMTNDEDLGSDASQFFNTITGYSAPRTYKKIEAAPLGLKAKLLELIDAETQRRKQGEPAHIMAKINALADPEIINALYDASAGGVPIDLNVRGICMLKPGIEGLSENIKVKSIVDRFLEHSRIYYFYHGGEKKVYIASADWMSRNLNKRIELMTPIEDADGKRKVLHILQTCLDDTVNCWHLMADGGYVRVDQGTEKKKRIRSQEAFYEEYKQREEKIKLNQPTVFEPHRAPSVG